MPISNRANEIVSISLQIVPYKTMMLQRDEELIRQMLMDIAGSLSNQTVGGKKKTKKQQQSRLEKTPIM